MKIGDTVRSKTTKKQGSIVREGTVSGEKFYDVEEDCWNGNPEVWNSSESDLYTVYDTPFYKKYSEWAKKFCQEATPKEIELSLEFGVVQAGKPSKNTQKLLDEQERLEDTINEKIGVTHEEVTEFLQMAGRE